MNFPASRRGLYAVGPFFDRRGPHGGLRYTLALRRELDSGFTSVSVTMKGGLPEYVPMGVMDDSSALLMFAQFVTTFHPAGRP